MLLSHDMTLRYVANIVFLIFSCYCRGLVTHWGGGGGGGGQGKKGMKCKLNMATIPKEISMSGVRKPQTGHSDLSRRMAQTVPTPVIVGIIRGQ